MRRNIRRDALGLFDAILEGKTMLLLRLSKNEGGEQGGGE
jgi:hypothetical protein